VDLHRKFILVFLGRLAKEGYTDPTEVQKVLKEYVKHTSTGVVELCPFDRAYFPTTTDISNHLYKARMGLQLSKIDHCYYIVSFLYGRK